MTHFLRVLFACLMAIVFCNSATAQDATAAQLDEIAKLSAEQFDMQKETFKEAREFLKNDKHGLTSDKLAKAETVKSIEALYTAGATRVYFTAIVEEGENRKAPAMMLIVGGQPAVRTKTFEAINAFLKSLLDAAGKPELFETLKQVDAGQPVLSVALEY
ncbi:MAG: hypothetical protein QM775_20690 [Pirellulales bacterium]